eukprot:scaffold295_cov257-Pinguiococcus_pyrenoidosus.AAC.7
MFAKKRPSQLYFTLRMASATWCAKTVVARNSLSCIAVEQLWHAFTIHSSTSFRFGDGSATLLPSCTLPDTFVDHFSCIESLQRRLAEISFDMRVYPRVTWLSHRGAVFRRKDYKYIALAQLLANLCVRVHGKVVEEKHCMPPAGVRQQNLRDPTLEYRSRHPCLLIGLDY